MLDSGVPQSSTLSAHSLKETNESLRFRLRELINEVQELFPPTDSRGGMRAHRLEEVRSSRTLKRDLISLQEKVEMKRKAVEALYRGSSIRLLEDQIKSTRKKLEEACSEISVLEAEALGQTEALRRVKTSPIVDDLQNELVVQKKVHAELRRSNTDLEHQLRVKQRVCGQLEEQLSRSIHKRQPVSG